MESEHTARTRARYVDIRAERIKKNEGVWFLYLETKIKNTRSPEKKKESFCFFKIARAREREKEREKERLRSAPEIGSVHQRSYV